MNISKLKQGQPLKAIMTPDYMREGTAPFLVGWHGCASITVTQLAGPMGWYDCAHLVFDNGMDDQIIPLHHCDFIQLLTEETE